MKKLVITGALLAAGCLGSLQASQTARDNGVVSVALPSNSRKIVNVPVVRSVEHEGTVTGSSANSVSETGGFASGSFNEAAGDNKWELEITSGRHIGLTLPVISNTASTVFLSGPVPNSTLLNGSTFVVRKSWTPGSLFGTTTNQVTAKGVKAGLAQTLATQIEIYNAVSNVFTAKYFFSSLNNRWQDGGGANVNDARLGPPTAFIVTEPSAAGATTLKLAGEVRKTRTLLPVGGGVANTASLIGNPNVASITLANSGMVNTNGESSAQHSAEGNLASALADEVRQFFGASLTNFFYSTLNNQWQQSSGGANANAQQISAGEGFIYKHNDVGASYIAIDAVNP